MRKHRGWVCLRQGALKNVARSPSGTTNDIALNNFWGEKSRSTLLGKVDALTSFDFLLFKYNNINAAYTM